MPTLVAVAAAAGFPLVDTAIVADLDEQPVPPRKIGFPVALKGIGSAILHKTEIGALALSLVDEQPSSPRVWRC